MKHAWCAMTIVALALGSSAVSPAQAPPPPLTIEQVVARFLDRNLAVEAARHRVDIARAEQIAAGLRPNPTLTVSAENLKFAGPTPAGELYEVGATYSQPIERGDKRRHRRAVADSTVAVAEAELAETLGQRLLEVKRVFYETVSARRTVDQAATNLRDFNELVRVTETRLKEGAVPEAEALKVRLERSRFQNALAQAQLGMRQAGIKLLDLLGHADFASAGAVTGDPTLPAGAVPDLGALKASALRRRPSVRAAEQSLVLAGRRVELERAQRTVDVAPFFGLRQVGENSTVLLGIAIPLPVSDRNQAGIARAVAEEKATRTELALRRNRALADVESAFQAWQSARQRMSAYETGLLRQADESLAIALRAYQEGAVELIGYLEAQRTRADIHHQYLQTILDARGALLLLEHATGEEFK